MNKFSVDYTDLQSKLNRKKAYRLSDVQHRIKKVAFDVVRFVDSDRIDDLWQIQREGEDEYIVAMYDESLDDNAKTASASNNTIDWKVIANHAGESVNVFYRNSPITRIVLAQMDIPSDDVHLVCKYLPQKLANDNNFRADFIANLTDAERDLLLEEDPSILGK